MSILKLPLDHPHGMNAYLHLTYPFAVLGTQPHLKPWLYERFVNLYLGVEGDFMYTGYDFDVVCTEAFYHTSFTRGSWSPSWAVVPYALEQLARGYYVYLWVDEYELPGQRAYHFFHFRHVILLYGYDDEAEEFLALAMDADRRFMRVRFAADAVERGWIAGLDMVGEDFPLLSVLRPKRMERPYPFSLRRFAAELCAYACGADVTMANYWALIPCYSYGGTLPYGYPAVGAWLDRLRGLERMRYTDFRGLHFLYEHKKALLERLRYIVQMARDGVVADGVIYAMPYGAPDTLEALDASIADIEGLLPGYDALRWQYLRSDVAGDAGDGATLAAILEGIDALWRREAALLPPLVEAVRRLLADQRTADRLHPNGLDWAACTCERLPVASGYRARLCWTFEQPQRAFEVRVNPRTQARLWLDGRELLWHTAVAEDAETLRVPLPEDTYCRTLSAELDSDFPIDPADAGVYLRVEALSRGCAVEASSAWVDADPAITAAVAPASVADGRDNTWWNAHPAYDGGAQWVQLTLPAPARLQGVLVRERIEVARVRDYTVELDAGDGVWREVARHVGALRERAVWHPLAGEPAARVRVVIHATVADAHGNAEPALARVELYGLTEDRG